MCLGGVGSAGCAPWAVGERGERRRGTRGSVLGLTAPSCQMGTNKCASQSGMTAYGTRRHLYDPKNQILPPMDHSTISLQMGTNKCASQVSPALRWGGDGGSTMAQPALSCPSRWA